MKRPLPNIDDDEICYKKAMTSPRLKSPGNYHGFRTPQPIRSYDTNNLLARRRRLRRGDSESADEPSVLHRVREHNIRKRNLNAPKGNQVTTTTMTSTRDSSSSGAQTIDDLFSQDENTAPSESSAGKSIDTPLNKVSL